MKYQKEQEAVDVYTALEVIKMDSKREGEIKGSVETYKEFHCSLQDAILVYF